MKEIKSQKKQEVKKEIINRREAMTKMSLAAFSVATMLLLLNKPEKAQAQDTSGNPDDPDTW